MEKIPQSPKVVITGGPGMGKTTIITAMSAQGYNCIPEVGRRIIQQQICVQGNKLPWVDPLAFAQTMFEHAVIDYENCNQSHINAPIFFDRGIPDVMGYLTLSGLEIPDQILDAAKKYTYFPKVFITPPWEDIYVNDTERKQSFDEAIATYITMEQTYIKLGYTLINIPRVSVSERVRFILSQISQN